MFMSRLPYRVKETFVGYDSESQKWISTVGIVEWLAAEAFFKKNPSAVKYYPYEYGEQIQYKFENQIINLSHDFIILDKKIFAISNNDDRHLIGAENWSQEGIKPEEWQFAYERLVKEKDGAKLHTHYKNLKNKYIFHAFIRFQSGEIVALSGRGWEIKRDDLGKLKYAVNKAGKFLAVKLIRKDKMNEEYKSVLISEITATMETGLENYAVKQQDMSVKQLVTRLGLFNELKPRPLNENTNRCVRNNTA